MPRKRKNPNLSGKTVQVNMRLEYEYKRHLKKMARRCRRSITDMVRQWIIDDIKKENLNKINSKEG